MHRFHILSVFCTWADPVVREGSFFLCHLETYSHVVVQGGRDLRFPMLRLLNFKLDYLKIKFMHYLEVV